MTPVKVCSPTVFTMISAWVSSKDSKRYMMWLRWSKLALKKSGLLVLLVTTNDSFRSFARPTSTGMPSISGQSKLEFNHQLHQRLMPVMQTSYVVSCSNNSRFAEDDLLWKRVIASKLEVSTAYTYIQGFDTKQKYLQSRVLRPGLWLSGPKQARDK